MPNSEEISLFTSLLGGAAIGLISGLFGALIRALAKIKIPAAPAMIVGVLVGIGAGILLLLASERSTSAALASCAVFGALVPLCSASRMFVASPEAEATTPPTHED